jgi:hypothetical protein
MKANLQLLEQRHETPSEELSDFVANNFGGNLLTLRQLEPLIIEMQRRFKSLPRKLGVDGKYKTIAGHRSFESWCHGVLGRNARCVRYMLMRAREPKNSEPKSRKQAETTSAIAMRCAKYIANKKLDTLTKIKILALLKLSTVKRY